jgi:LL-diaminopimelate aminotransferase
MDIAADRVANLPPYVFASLGARIARLRAEGKDIIRLDIGSPDLPPPDSVIEALYRSAKVPSHHGYPGYAGRPELRSAIVDYYQRRFGVDLDPDTQVVTLIGSKEGIVHVLLSTVNPEDVVLVPDPGYPSYALGTLLAGGEPVSMPLLAENGFLPDLEAIPSAALQRARLMWLNYPNNPTGATAPYEFFEEAIRFAKSHDLLILHDNPYCDVTYGGYVAPSMLQVPGATEVVLEFNSLSKTYNMAGWRVGMAVGNVDAVAALSLTKTNVDSGIFRPIQDAAVQALNGDQSWLLERNEIYRERRDLILSALERWGIEASRPQASLYVWARTPKGWTSAEFTDWVLDKTGVSITPGSVYGTHGEGYLRFSVGMATDLVREAMERLSALPLQ